MNVDRLGVTVPAELGAEIRKLADERGEPLSALVADAISHRLRLAALDKALRAADAKFGPIAEAEIQRAMAALLSAVAEA